MQSMRAWFRRCANGLCSVLAAHVAAQADAPPATVDRLLVANKAEHTVSIFDVATRKELVRLPTGEGPHEVAVSDDGRTAVVSDYGAQKPGSTLTVIDLVASKVLRTIELSFADGEERKLLLRPHGLQFVARHEVAVTSERARRLAIVDIAAGVVRRTVTTPQTTMHMVAAGTDRQRLAATSIREGSVALFDLREGAAASPKIVPTGEGAEGLAVHATKGEVWVGNRAANTASVVSLETAEVIAELPTADFPFRMVFTPDGKLLLVSCAEGGVVQLFDVDKRAAVGAIDIHGDSSELSALPMGLCVDPEGLRCYVACGRGEFIAVLDLRERTVVARLPAGRGADGIVYARVPVAPLEGR